MKHKLTDYIKDVVSGMNDFDIAKKFNVGSDYIFYTVSHKIMLIIDLLEEGYKTSYIAKRCELKLATIKELIKEIKKHRVINEGCKINLFLTPSSRTHTKIYMDHYEDLKKMLLK